MKFGHLLLLMEFCSKTTWVNSCLWSDDVKFFISMMNSFILHLCGVWIDLWRWPTDVFCLPGRKFNKLCVAKQYSPFVPFYLNFGRKCLVSGILHHTLSTFTKLWCSWDLNFKNILKSFFSKVVEWLVFVYFNSEKQGKLTFKYCWPYEGVSGPNITHTKKSRNFVFLVLMLVKLFCYWEKKIRHRQSK